MKNIMLLAISTILFSQTSYAEIGKTLSDFENSRFYKEQEWYDCLVTDSYDMFPGLWTVASNPEKYCAVKYGRNYWIELSYDAGISPKDNNEKNIYFQILQFEKDSDMEGQNKDARFAEAFIQEATGSKTQDIYETILAIFQNQPEEDKVIIPAEINGYKLYVTTSEHYYYFYFVDNPTMELLLNRCLNAVDDFFSNEASCSAYINVYQDCSAKSRENAKEYYKKRCHKNFRVRRNK